MNWFLCAAVCLGGCAHGLGRGHPTTVDELYTQGVEEMEGGLYPEAIKVFSEVKTKYPYSRFAPLAELRIGDTHVKRSKFQEGIDTYRSFLKFHPNHEQANYALFRIGEAYFEQLPSDWWFLPPGAEKDQGNTRMAIAAYQDMLARFDSGPMAEQAHAHLDACRRRLADHEMYVATFYFKRQHYAASAQRAEALLNDYAGLGLDPDALWIIGKSRFSQGQKDAAKAALQKLLDQFPQCPQAPEARALLASLGVSANPLETYPATRAKT